MRTDPLPLSEIQRRLNERLGEISDWDRQGRFRHTYPVSRPLDMSIDTLSRFWEKNSNNIGVHFDEPNRLRGTRRLEREVVRDVASLMGESDADGWLTTGATEGNLTALWLARQRLKRIDRLRPRVFISKLTHESVRKACRILCLDDIVEIPLRDCAAMDVAVLSDRLAEAARDGCGSIVVATVGATLTGTCDRVDNIAANLPHGFPVHLHVDAAFAGLVLPFSDPDRAFDFRVSAVDTLVVDLHKMARLPLGVGIFLARPGSTSELAAPSPYAGVDDRTVLGSRPGALAAAAWAGVNSLGRHGLARDVGYCLDLKNHFVRRLNDYGTIIHDRAVNALAHLPAANVLTKAERYYFLPHLDKKTVDRLAARLMVKSSSDSKTEIPCQ